MSVSTKNAPEEDDTVTISFDVSRDVWDLLLEIADLEPWKAVAAKALEAGLDQVRTPTLSGRPHAWRGS